MQDVYSTRPNQTSFPAVKLSRKRSILLDNNKKEFDPSNSGSQESSMRTTIMDRPPVFDHSAPISQIILQGNMVKRASVISEVQVEVP